jgi:dolichyl-phosphate-mannose--protein O-mannosyl transferase
VKEQLSKVTSFDVEELRWSRLDTIVLTLLTAVAGAIRAVYMTFPSGITFDELFYAREACIYVYQSPELCGIPLDAVSPHPPLGKLIISLGVLAFGWEALGWRAAVLVAGTASVALLYVLARRLLGTTRGALFAGSLLAIDFLHFVYSRIAMIDTFLTFFIVASFLFVVIDRDWYFSRTAEVTNSTRGVLSKAFSRPWLLAAGLAAGGAIATKWVGLGCLAGVGILSSAWILIRPSPEKLYTKVQGALRTDWPAMTMALVVAPIVVYILAFAPIVDGSVVSPPWVRGSWPRNFAREQLVMFNFHFPSAATYHRSEVYWVGKTHPDVSPAWSWPLIKRPELHHREDNGAEHRRIIALGSPLVWWTSLAALAYLAVQLTRGRRNDAALVALTGISVLYMPFVVITGVRSAPFLHDILPSVPFMCLALATAPHDWKSSWSRPTLIGFATAAVALFVFFYPILTGSPLSEEELDARMWFQDCRPSADIAAPAGWCWK